MRRKFAANLIFLLTANLLVKPYWIFGIDRVVQNRVGPELYGTYFAVFNYSFLFSILLDFGINNFNNRAISRNNKRLGEYLTNLMMIKMALSVLYLVITFLSALAAGFNEQQLFMLFALAINQILLSAILYFRSNIAALQLFKVDSFISVLDRLLTIIFCTVLMYAPLFKDSFTILWFIYAQTAALLLTALVAFFIIAGKTVIALKIWKGKYTRMILLKSMPFALLALLMGIYYRIDGVMIERMLPNGAQEAGIYAASFRLLDAVNMFGYLFATLLLPLFAGMIRRNENINALVKFSSELMFSGSVMIGLICYFFRQEIIQLLYHSATEYWWTIFGWLMLNFIPMSTVYVFGTLLTAKGNMKALNIIAITGVAINVGLNIFLIPAKGALGATIATLLTQLITAVAHIAVARKTFRLHFDTKDIFRMCAFCVLSMGSVFLFSQIDAPWFVNLLLAGTACIILTAAFRIVPVQQVLVLIKQQTGKT